MNWFKSIIAVNKIARDDLLIGAHLVLDLIRDCLVMGMILRDKHSGNWNHIISKLADTQQPFTTHGLLVSLSHSAIAFDQLANQFLFTYQPLQTIFQQWLDATRKMLES